MFNKTNYHFDNVLRRMNNQGLIGLFNDVVAKFAIELHTSPGSIRHHHSEIGGYIRHIDEVMSNCGIMIVELGFIGCINIKDITKLAFIHDLDKLQRYEVDPDKPTKKQRDYAKTLGIQIENMENKSSLSIKISNKVEKKDDPIQYFRYKDILAADDSAKVVRLCLELGIKLTDEDVHCLSLHHGGWSSINGKMTPMATILHTADLISTNIQNDIDGEL